MKYVIKAPLVTEKNTLHNSAGVYVFEVDFDATKTDVKNTVEKNFNVKVASVRTTVCRGKGKVTRFGKTKTPYWKKAYVTLKTGEKISMFEGV